MPDLADAFRARWPMQPQARDPMMSVPQVGLQPLNPPMQRPLYTQEAPQQPGFGFPPGFIEFLRNQMNQRRL
jgi:hypothetical protein